MIKLKNQKQVEKYLRFFSQRIENMLLYQLEYLVAELQNHAKLSAGYEDQTSNLKSSIGGVVLKDGNPISYKGFDGSPTGTSTGMDFINSLISEQGRGYVIILVAGMEYATYVENKHGLNVLKQSELKMLRELPKIMDSLKQKISRINENTK
jgi:hypothetical protein